MSRPSFKTIRLYQDAFFLEEYLRNRPFEEVMRSWNMYTSNNQWFFEHYFSTQTGEEDLENRLKNVCKRVESIRQMAVHLENNLQDYVDRAIEAFGSPHDLSFDVIAFVGLWASDGWVDFLRQKLCVCIALEYYDNISGFETCVVHERCHVIPAAISMRKCPERKVAKFEILRRAASEGIAIYASQLVLPSISDSSACFYSEKEYTWCLDHKEQLIHSFVRDLDDASAMKKYFSSSYRGTLPPRTGYFIGKVLIEHVAIQKSLLDIVLTPSDEMIKDIRTIRDDLKHQNNS